MNLIFIIFYYLKSNKSFNIKFMKLIFLYKILNSFQVVYIKVTKSNFLIELKLVNPLSACIIYTHQDCRTKNDKKQKIFFFKFNPDFINFAFANLMFCI